MKSICSRGPIASDSRIPPLIPSSLIVARDPYWATGSSKAMVVWQAWGSLFCVSVLPATHAAPTFVPYPSYGDRHPSMLPSLVAIAIFFVPLLDSVVQPHWPPPPLARRPNRGHVGVGGWAPSCGTCLWFFLSRMGSALPPSSTTKSKDQRSI